MKGFGFASLFSATCLYAAFLVGLTFLNRSGADRWWPGAFNLYLPQAIWALPGLVLIPLFLKAKPTWVWLPLVCTLWVLGPLMDFQWSARPAPGAQVGRLRVMTWNIKYGFHDLSPLIEELARCNPDLVLFQDAGGSLKTLAPYFRGWQVRSLNQYLVASRYPISAVETFELPSLDEREKYLRCQLQLGATPITVFNVHFKTPRDSLNAFRRARRVPWYLPRAIQRFTDNVADRQLQAMTISTALSAERGPVIVAGDLNAPDSSLACGILRQAGMHDAFAEAGRGYGYTYGHLLLKHRLPWFKLSWMRIDHIMVSRGFQAVRCWTGTGEASDHKPVIADLVLRNPD